jgi:hypothetical protein
MRHGHIYGAMTPPSPTVIRTLAFPENYWKCLTTTLSCGNFTVKDWKEHIAMYPEDAEIFLNDGKDFQIYYDQSARYVVVEEV